MYIGEPPIGIRKTHASSCDHCNQYTILFDSIRRREAKKWNQLQSNKLDRVTCWGIAGSGWLSVDSEES